MKINKYNLCSLWILIIIITSAVAFSHELPRSFRNQATGNALVDDLDLVYDPIELSFVDSVKIYTNLSNLVSSREEIMNNYSANTFLLGISGPFPLLNNMNSSLLAKYNNTTDPRNLSIDSDLDGTADLFGEGDLEDKFVAYMDTDVDGLFDLKRQLDQEKHNNVSTRQQDIYLTGSTPSGSLILGGQMGYGNYVSENSVTPVSLGRFFTMGDGAFQDDPSFYSKYQVFDLEADSVVDNFTEEGSFDNVNKSSYVGVGFSAMSLLNLPCGTTEGRVDIGILMTKDEESNDNHYRYQKDDLQVLGGYYKNSDKYNESEITDETIVSVGLSLKRIFQPSAERRNNGFWRVGLGYGMGFGSYDYTKDNPSSESNSRPLDLVLYQMGLDSTFVESVDQVTYKTTDKGDVSSHTLSLSAHAQVPMGDRTYFGIGMRFQLRSSTWETDYLDAYEAISIYEVLDDTATVNDVTESTTYSISHDRTYETQQTRFEVPLGLEYALTKNKKWRIRFGAHFIYNQLVVNDASEVSDSQPEISRTETGDGNVVVDIDMDDSEYVSMSEHSERVYTQTIYTYGLGFYPNQNVQIDLLGFWGTAPNSILDASFWRHLRLSITVGL